MRQAGSAVRPDKLRFDFTHGAPLSNGELGDIGDRVNDWIKESHSVRALEMSRMDAERLGAMALFGEKYGDWVRVVEVEDVSRELCGGTHILNTASIGITSVNTASALVNAMGMGMASMATSGPSTMRRRCRCPGRRQA